MSTKVRKCPECGARVPENAKYCRKCSAPLTSGRVEILPREPQRQRPREVFEDLPRPIRPVQKKQDFVEDTIPGEEWSDAADRRYQERNTSSPRPTSTARGPGYEPPPPPERNTTQRLWQTITVLAIILVIMIVAIVLVMKLSRPVNRQTSETFQPPAAQQTPLPEITPNTTIITPQPENTPAVNTEAPEPQQTGEAEPTTTPEPSATPTPDHEITAADDTVYVTGIGVNIRRGPGTDYDIINSVSAGYELHRTGRVDNGWSRVEYNGGVGYVIDTYITTTKPTETPAPSYTVTEASGTVKVASNANLRSGPGTSYDVITTVNAGTELTRTGTTGGWTRVTYGGRDVFISTDLLESDSSNGNSGSDVTDDSGTVTITGNGVRVRSGPSTNDSQIGTVSSGDTLTVTGKTDGWYRVEYNGQTGYVSADYATKN